MYYAVWMISIKERPLSIKFYTCNEDAEYTSSSITESVYVNLTQTAYHGLEQFLQNLRSNAILHAFFLHEFAFILKFDAALLLQIRFESDRLWPFLF